MEKLTEIQALLKKSDSKLFTAELEFENKRYDDSVSRSYYAVFHAISALLLSKNLTFSSHGQTIGAFNREFIKTGLFPKEFNNFIHALFEDRQIGDYDAMSEIDSETAEKNLHYAKTIIQAVKIYFKQ
ncbi:MAG TPA: DNA-binding protein [Spirochaetia bacterium]|nr:MAG: hypothetical protein A2Y41_05020 [Spirochaetes bacterium GWB1_36_13]HCL57061.1 DNA-binding protein [Spirochaetia bacterium]